MGEIQESEWESFARAGAILSEVPIFIDDTPAISPLEIRTKSRRVHAEHGLQLVVVDYLQLMGGGGRTENRVQEISQISRSLKALAMELRLPVIALSQLSRATEARQPPIPRLSDLRESGSIEQDADVVLMIYRDEMYNEDSDRKGLADIEVAKHRNGPTGKVQLYFAKQVASFADAEIYRQPEGY
jgi:replicative DNA helicase